jgi:hypothetical protein
MYGQPGYPPQQYGQPQYGQPQYGQPQFGQPQYGQPQFGQPQFGQQSPGVVVQTTQVVFPGANPWKLSRDFHSNTGHQLVRGHQTDGSGELFCAVAHSQYGDIPGKAQGTTCWFPYGGKEELTSNFSWLHVTSSQLLRQSYPPPNAIPSGRQNDASGTVYSAIAHSQWGDIPGKAAGSDCWFPYGGKEHNTKNFSWVCTPLTAQPTPISIPTSILNPMPTPIPGFGVPGFSVSVNTPKWRLERDPNATNGGHLVRAFQTDGYGEIFAAVAHSQHGNVPGKARGNECWYPYGGAEHRCSNFSYVIVHHPHMVRQPTPPINAIPSGHQTDSGTVYTIIAHTQWGDIPGKAVSNGNGWFCHGGKEHTTLNFSWVCHQ